MEALTAMFCVSFAVLLCAQMNVFVSFLSRDLRRSDDVLALHQVRLILAQSKNVNLKDEVVQFRYHDQEYLFRIDKNRLIKTPGYEIFMEEVDTGYFIETDNCIYMIWERGEYKHEALLYCE